MRGHVKHPRALIARRAGSAMLQCQRINWWIRARRMGRQLKYCTSATVGFLEFFLPPFQVFCRLDVKARII